MKTEKMSFKNIKDVLKRDEMKQIMAGSGVTCTAYRSGYYVTGSCSGSSFSACVSYCINAGYTLCACY